MKLSKVVLLILILLFIIFALLAVIAGQRNWKSITELATGIAVACLGFVITNWVYSFVHKPELEKPELQVVVTPGESIKAQEFPPDGKFLSFAHTKVGVRVLHQMIDKSGFWPDVIVGVDRVSMLAAAAIHTLYQVPIGCACASGDRSNRQVGWISLPYNCQANSLQEFDNGEIKILIVDTKFKSGNSAKAVGEKLKDIYNTHYQEVEIRYAVVLLYTGGFLDRNEIKTTYNWPVLLKIGKSCMKLYAAYYTNEVTVPDRIGEELRSQESLEVRC